MFWHTVSVIADFMFFPIMLVMCLTGLIMVFSGLRHIRNGAYREQRLSWYEYPTIFAGISIILFALFFSVFVASTYISNPFIRGLVLLAGIAPEILWIFFRLGVSRRSSLLLSKHREVAQPKHKDTAQAQPKDER